MSCIRRKRGPYRKQLTNLNSGNICDEVDDDFQEVISSVQFNFISSLCGLNTKKYRG